MPQKLRLTLLGNVSIQKEKKPVSGLPSRAAEALFIYLACNQRPVTREKLAELLWAERTSTQALTNLRTILTSLRRELGDFLIVTRDTLAFNGESDAWLDTTEFEHQLKDLGLPGREDIPGDQSAATKLQAALDLYQGDFLDGFYLRDGHGFEEWVILQREHLRQLAHEGLRMLTRYYREKGFHAEGILSASRWQRLDPYDEDACRTLMWLFMRTGQRTAALQCYQNLKQKLNIDLGIVPASASTDLFRQFQHVEFPPLLNLLSFATSFVGRKEEIAELERRLTSTETRLVTIIGPGGIGKTRLAVEAARSLAERKPGQFLHGISFVPLATVDTPETISFRIAESIGLTFRGSESPQKELLEYLREREILLILDNFEHLVDEEGSGTAFLVEILHQALGIKLLVTSRERLNLYVETIFDAHGLDVPQEGAPQPEEYSAMALFLQNARRVQRGFDFTKEETAAAMRICRLVEGMPLAIELASAWVRHYTCAQIATQIEKDLDFLAIPYQDAPASHRSLRAVFERSWALLSSQEQAAFSQLSIFSGGFTMQAANAVIGLPSSTDEWTPVIDLTDKSLLQRQSDGRYDIHPLLRQYAAEKLSALPDAMEAAASRHTSYYLDFLTQLGNGESPQQRAMIRPERDNIRIAWERASKTGMFQALERTAGILHSFFSVQSWFLEGIDLFQNAISAIEQKDQSEATGLLCELLGRKARMQIQIGQLEKARADLLQALKHLENMDDPSRRSRVLDSLAITNYYAGDYPQAAALAKESLSLSEKTDNLDGTAFALNFLGSCAKAQGDYDQSRAYFERAVTAYHTIKDEIGAAMVLNNLGNLLQTRGDFEGAQQYYMESGGILKTHDHVHGAATTLANAGKLTLKQGKYDTARTLLGESLEMKHGINDRRGEAVALAGLADISLAMDALAEAREILLQALELARQVSDVQLTLDILVAVAALTVKQGRKEIALRLLSFVLNHAGSAEEARQRAVRLLEELGNPSLTEHGLWNQELIEDMVSAVLLEA
ncbi:MAG: tetratricopeptide repeat protein [Anaerolineales bacterium]|nr:tetratricopeptide repeat protein [Anaerolineales bacterium]